MQVKQRIARARHAVLHLAADTAVTARVRVPLDAWPRAVKGGHGQAGVDVGLGRARTHLVVDGPVDAVVSHLVARAERVGVVGEGAVRDALAAAGAAVPAEAVGSVEEDRGAEFTRVALFGPVAKQREIVSFWGYCGGQRGLEGKRTADSRCSCTRTGGRSRGSAS